MSAIPMAIMLGLLAPASAGEAAWPNKTLMLVSEPTMLVLADPGPGWIPEGEPESSQLRQSFYYHGTGSSRAISIVLVEADCGTTGKWRTRANTDVAVNEAGNVELSRQSLSTRASAWTMEADKDGLGMAAWENTCRGNTSVGSVGDFTPWAGALLWQQHQQIKVDPEAPKP